MLGFGPEGADLAVLGCTLEDLRRAVMDLRQDRVMGKRQTMVQKSIWVCSACFPQVHFLKRKSYGLEFAKFRDRLSPEHLCIPICHCLGPKPEAKNL